MPTTVLTPDTTNDGYIRSTNASYSTARAGGGSLTPVSTGSTMDVGQFFSSPNYSCIEGFVSFDTTGISPTGVTSVELKLYGNNDLSVTDFTIQARTASWASGGLTSADYVAGASISGTLLATFNTSGFTTSDYNVFTSETAFLSAINGSGLTEIMLVSDRLVSGTTPTGNEYVTVNTADDAASRRPTLTVVWDPKDAPETMRVVTSNQRW